MTQPNIDDGNKNAPMDVPRTSIRNYTDLGFGRVVAQSVRGRVLTHEGEPTSRKYGLGGQRLERFYLRVLAAPLPVFLAWGLGALLLLNGFFTLGQWTWLAIYPAELFPTHLRATAITIAFNATRFVAAAGTLATAALIGFFGSISAAAVVVGSIYILGLLVTPWIGPETRGQPLPEADEFAPTASSPAAAIESVPQR